MKRLRAPWNPYRRIAAAVLHDALTAAQRGDARACAWVESVSAEGWAASIGFDLEGARRALHRLTSVDA